MTKPITDRPVNEAARALVALRRKAWFTCALPDCGKVFEAQVAVKRDTERTCSAAHRVALHRVRHPERKRRESLPTRSEGE